MNLPFSRKLLGAALLPTALLGCSDPAQTFVMFDVVGVVDGPSHTRADGGVITLTEGTVGFGPLVFCASATASPELCDTSVAEWTSRVGLDVTTAGPTPLGTATGLTGAVKSAGFDYGVFWLLTETEPRGEPSIAAGHSARLSGTFTRDGASVPFSATVDCAPQLQGGRAVTTAPASGVVSESTSAVEVHLRPATWFEGVDFDAALAAGEPLIVEPDTPDHDALVLAMKSQSVPTFVWRSP